MNSERTKVDAKSVEIIDAVKAESARVGVSGKQLADALGRDRNFIYERFRYEKPFDTNDLQGIAKRLGITIADILRSAALGAEIHGKALA